LVAELHPERRRGNVSNGFDLRDESMRNVVGAALRTTYELEAPMPEHLQSLLDQLQRRLDKPAPDTGTRDPEAPAEIS
jgi:hypothetical protein